MARTRDLSFSLGKITMEALGGKKMLLYWAVIFLVLAIIAAIFGFGAVAATGIGIAKVLFWIFVVLFIVSLIAGYGKRPGVTPHV